MKSRRRSLALAVALAAILAVLLLASGGCRDNQLGLGVAVDDEPRALALDRIPAALRPGALPEADVVLSADGATQPIFMVGPDNRLIVVYRDVPATPDAVIESLLNDVTQRERQQGIDSAMTRTTEVLAIDLDPLFQRALVTLSPESLGASTEDQLLGFGQLVFTLTELDDIATVGFQTNSGPTNETAVALQVQTDIGLREPGEQVGRAAFASIDTVGRNIIPTFPDEDAVATPEPTLPPAGVGRTIEVPIWLLNPDNQLVQVSRRLERTEEALIRTLLDGPLAVEADQGFRSAISEDALAKDIDNVVIVDDERGPLGTAVVDLSAGSLPPFEANDERTLAVAQIVFTLTGLVEIDQVIFSVEGVPTPMPTQFGLSEDYDLDNPAGGLTRSDYSEYAVAFRVIERPTPVPAGEAAPSADGEPAPPEPEPELAATETAEPTPVESDPEPAAPEPTPTE